ncbi:MAG: hypothetical protein WCE23_16405 [Candidatus Binatus sp.]|uniref:hypothetical protein n=1 Tax=Candidatus Binatus sp. TaxID=2811406 RepID=UPI003C7596CB
METERQSRHPRAAWPFDLRVFAAMAGLWAICVTIMAFVHIGDFDVVDPIETIFAGVRFSGDAACVVLVVEAGIFGAIAIGVFARRRWGLLLALCYMVQVVMSHLAFAIAYLPIRSEWINVRVATSEGPMMVLITLYLWIRACDLIFDPHSIPADARARQSSGTRRRAAVRADRGAGDVAAMAK